MSVRELPTLVSCEDLLKDLPRPTGGSEGAGTKVRRGLGAPLLVQTYYVPVTESQALTAFQQLYARCEAPIRSVIPMVTTEDGTVIYYDHWEDGYELDICFPLQVSMEIWGDDDPGNGIPPGDRGDVIDADDVVVLGSGVPLPRNPMQIHHDVRDKFSVSRAVAANRAEWTASNTQGTVLTGARGRYDGRWFLLWPREQWNHSYYTPAGSTGRDEAYVFAYNPNGTIIAVSYRT